MLARDLILEVAISLNPKQTVSDAQEHFMEQCMCHVPIVTEEDLLVGSLPVEVVFDEPDQQKQIAEFKADLNSGFVDDERHLINIFEVAARFELTAVPVSDQENKFIGVIPIATLLNQFANFYSFKEPGGVFTLETNLKNYDLSEISRVVESNNAKILSLFTHLGDDNHTLFITIKVNLIEVKHIVATFERFKYKIEVHQAFDRKANDLQDRYNLLMKYLDI